MGHKKYYGYKPPFEHYAVEFHRDTGKIGESLDFVYENGRCGMNHYYWGSEMEYERNKRGEVEANYIWDEENTKKLMLRTGTHNGKDLVKAMYERFGDKGSSADSYIRKFCEEKGIKYNMQVWY